MFLIFSEVINVFKNQKQLMFLKLQRQLMFLKFQRQLMFLKISEAINVFNFLRSN